MSYATISGDGRFYGREYETMDGNSTFQSMGRAVYVDGIYRNIEDNTFEWELSYKYLDREEHIRVPRKVLGDIQQISYLAGKGIDVTKRSFDTLLETLLDQERGYDGEGNCSPPPVMNVYNHIGWLEIANMDGEQSELCYRADSLLGSEDGGQYTGPFHIKQCGEFEEWKNMVANDVLGHEALELVLVAALAAVVNGLIAPHTNNENPILHLNYSSGKGKSTAGYLAVSTAGKPFEGSIPGTGICGEQVYLQSLYQSWGATDNAIVASQSGNYGAVVVLNELGKSGLKDIGQSIYYLSEGGEKKRYSGQNQKVNSSERYHTVFISTGEMSLLEKCQSKSEGLRVRVLELSQPLTDSADHANRIKNTCREHCGHAAPMLAQYILDNGGLGFALDKYKGWVEQLSEERSQSPSSARFHEKYTALFLATAEIASEALGISFNVDALKQFLLDYDKNTSSSRNTSAGSYDYIIEQCRINGNKFYRKIGKTAVPNELVSMSPHICWGRISKVKYHLGNRTVVEEFEVRPSIVEDLLKKGGYENIKTCIREWTTAKVLNRDEKRATRIRKIEDVGESVYVFRVFEVDETENPMG